MTTGEPDETLRRNIERFKAFTKEGRPPIKANPSPTLDTFAALREAAPEILALSERAATELQGHIHEAVKAGKAYMETLEKLPKPRAKRKAKAKPRPIFLPKLAARLRGSVSRLALAAQMPALQLVSYPDPGPLWATPDDLRRAAVVRGTLGNSRRITSYARSRSR